MNNEYMEQILNDKKYVYYAHRKRDSTEKELLSSHLQLTYFYYKKMENYKKLDEKIKQNIRSTFKVSELIVEKIYEMFNSAIYYHDIGKINPLFQKNKMNNDLKIEPKEQDDTHAALSARIYIDAMQKQINEENIEVKDKVTLIYVAYYFAYIISRHHTAIEGIANLEDAIKLKNIPQIEDGKDDLYAIQLEKLCNVIEKLEIDEIGIYILCKLLYSCIVTADFYATYDYMTGNKVIIENKNKKLFEKYESSELIQTIRKYTNNEIHIEGINKIRSDIFVEAERNLLNNMDNDIYYIKSPTGSGKTNMAINVAKVLYEKNENIKSIQYIFPFNNIIEQTAMTFESYFEKYNEFVVINSTTSMVRDTGESLDYEKEYIKNVFRQYPIIITSHINLFNTLFGIGKEANYGLYNLIDSVIVIDEIQSYSNNIWREIISMFSKYSELLNIKFVVMSATLPRLDKLLKNPITKFCSLIQDSEKYYQNEIFKNRVKLNFDLLNKKLDLNDLEEEILKKHNKKVLVECIKKDTANQLYNALKEKIDGVYILTSDDNKYRKKEIIEKSKSDEPVIIIATQTIEAGVDIDMDVGFKDISFLDSEEQFIGRINRSSKKNGCTAYFFDLDDARKIYINDNRLEFNLHNEAVQTWFKNKNFDIFYDKVMKKVYEKTELHNNCNIENFYSACRFINYKKVQKVMKLINNNTIQLFLNSNLRIDNTVISGENVFNEYRKIYCDNNMGYAEKKIKLSQITEKLNLFIYSIYENQANLIHGEKFGELYYIENGEQYMQDGRFNKKKYLNEGDEIFL